MDKDTLLIKRLKITSMIFMIIQLTSGVLMFTNNSVYWATICYMIAVIFQCLILLSTFPELADPKQIFEQMYIKGVFMFIYILVILGIYVYCISNSIDNIKENTMPSQWSWYSWIIAILVLVFMTPVLNIQITTQLDQLNPNASSDTISSDGTISKLIDVKNNQHNGIIISHFIFIFVYIQYIISTFYQTDGFRV